MRKFLLLILFALLCLILLTACGRAADSDPTNSTTGTGITTVTSLPPAPGGKTTVTEIPETTAPSTTTEAQQPETETLRLTVVADHLAAVTVSTGYRELISLDTLGMAPGHIMEITYNGQIMESYPGQVRADSSRDTGESDPELTVTPGTVTGTREGGYTFVPDVGDVAILFQSMIQTIPAGSHGTLAYYAADNLGKETYTAFFNISD